MGCDIHLYIERRQADGSWKLLVPPAPPTIVERTEQRVRHDNGQPYEYVSSFWGPGFYVSKCYGMEEDDETPEPVPPELIEDVVLRGRLLEIQQDPRYCDDEISKSCIRTGCPRCMGTGRDLQWWHDRNYAVFAMLTTTVRNNGDIRGIVPEPRGVPEDMSPELQRFAERAFDHSEGWLTLDEVLAYDWQQTFVTRGVVPLLPRQEGHWRGAGASYQEWRDMKPRKSPGSWSSSVGGGGTYTVDPATADRILAAMAEGRRIAHAEHLQDPDSIRFGFIERPRKVPEPDPHQCYVAIQWSDTYADRVGSFLDFVNEYLIPLGEPKDTRLVFGFDS